MLGRDVSAAASSGGLLKLMEETEVSLRTPFDLTSQLQAAMEFQSKGKVNRSVINTRHILFVSGAFTGLADTTSQAPGRQGYWIHLHRKIGPSRRGLFSVCRRATILSNTDSKGNSWVDYRWSSAARLIVDDLFQILKNSEGSIIRQYINAFEAYGIDFVAYTDPGLYRIAHKRTKTTRVREALWESASALFANTNTTCRIPRSSALN